MWKDVTGMQMRFRKERGTMDNVYVLNYMVNYIVNNCRGKEDGGSNICRFVCGFRLGG